MNRHAWIGKLFTEQPLLLILFLSLISLTIPFFKQAVALAKGPHHFKIDVVSSAADQVTGGDARLHIDVPRQVPVDRIKILVNGTDQSDHFSTIPGTHTLTGVVDGLKQGKNHIIVKQHDFGRKQPAKLTLINYPISGPVFSGPHQQPFTCTVQYQGMGQPLADNNDTGFPVFATDDDGNPTSEIIGYSLDCSAETLVTYMYRSTAGGFKPYTLGQARPLDMAQTTTLDNLTVDYIVRWERGTINRFIYSIAMLAPNDTSPQDLSRTAWNGKLIYYFQGGVAIGHEQGSPSGSRMLYDDGLSKGYAIAYSTGTKTGTHYNLVLGGETALMVKERFIELYDTPVYTVGVGASGGGIQQYVYGQNHKGLIDAAIPQYAYPDMITQAIHVGDCELLEFFMDVIDGTNPRWQVWSNRTLLEGLNASNFLFNPFTGSVGATECIIGWRGLSPLVFNPLYGYAEGQEKYEPQSAITEIEWTHPGDLVNVYGLEDDGYARRFWDNVGVQYGLTAVATGNITPAEFLFLNANIGGWKDSADMVQEGSPFYPPGVVDPLNWDPWSSRNQVLSPDYGITPAPRTAGNLSAMQAAYRSGLVFTGRINIPIIDWRNYLEDELNMHNSHQSFAARQRILDARHNADNQVIWFTDVDSAHPTFDQTPEALTVMDEWMTNILNHPHRGIAASKPAKAVDRCFDSQGNEIAAGNHVWDGILNDHAKGACTTLFPIYGTSRIVAGGPFKGSIFKCELQSIEDAIIKGLYGVWEPTEPEIERLKQIFPDGVCDFREPDMALPVTWHHH